MKDQLTQQILNISKVALASVGVALCVWLIAGGYPESDDKISEIDSFVNGDSGHFFAIDYVIYVIGLALIGVIGFFIYQLVIRPKRTALSILGLLISALVFIVLFYSGSSDTIADLQVKPEQVGPSTIALTTAGIYTIGICLSLGILAIVLGPVMGRYRK